MNLKEGISKKIALIGSFAVGKTSLINRFVYRQFPENYLTTLGMRVDKKVVTSGKFDVSLLIWDIAGHDQVENTPGYYLTGSKGIVVVTDLSRPATFERLDRQLQVLRAIVPDAEVLVAANKQDLFSEQVLAHILKGYPVQPDFLTSALSGANVDALFEALTARMIQRHESSRS
jgi:small GTP-binding protein